MIYIPPNGFTGSGQQTQAAQLVTMGMPRNGGRKRRRKAKRATAKRRAAPRRRAKRATAKRASRKGRMVKGSPAAKRHMAKLRRMRKR